MDSRVGRAAISRAGLKSGEVECANGFMMENIVPARWIVRKSFRALIVRRASA